MYVPCTQYHYNVHDRVDLCSTLYQWIIAIKFMIYCAVFMPISNAFNPMNDQATLNITFNYSFVYKWWVIQPIESWTTQRAICHGNVCFWLTHIAMAMKHWNDSNVSLEI